MTSDDFFPVLLKERAAFATGGLAGAADAVRDAGRGGDDVLIHVNQRELAEIMGRWGEPTINPETGLPEFFLGSIGDFFKDNPWLGTIAPIATGILAPGLGSGIGDTLSNAVGANLSPGWDAAIGNGLLGAGIGALTGGGKGALMGGLLGGLTGYMGAPSGYATVGQGGMGPDMPDAVKAANGLSSSDSSGGLSGVFGGGGGAMAKALPLALVAASLSGGIGGSKKEASTSEISPEHQAAIDRNQRGLSNVKIRTKAAPMLSDDRLRTYGRGDGAREYQFFKNNSMPEIEGLAQGGMPQGYASAGAVANHVPSRYVSGPGDGRQDLIPAALSDGEYVISAEEVAMLGNGSSKAGAKALDRMRVNIRKHKGKALAQGKFSPDAKPAESYLQGAI